MNKSRDLLIRTYSSRHSHGPISPPGRSCRVFEDDTHFATKEMCRVLKDDTHLATKERCCVLKDDTHFVAKEKIGKNCLLCFKAMTA